jgi:hypothetical protein
MRFSSGLTEKRIVEDSPFFPYRSFASPNPARHSQKILLVGDNGFDADALGEKSGEKRGRHVFGRASKDHGLPFWDIWQPEMQKIIG